MYRKCETTTPNSAIAKVFRCIHLNVTKILNEIQIQRIDKILWINCAWHLVLLSCCFVFFFHFVLIFRRFLFVCWAFCRLPCVRVYVYSWPWVCPCIHCCSSACRTGKQKTCISVQSARYTSKRFPTKFLQAHWVTCLDYDITVCA